MTRIYGPLNSIEARGTLGKILEFSTRRGRAFLRKHQQPTGAPTAGQIGQRAYYLEASLKWDTLTSGEKLLWTTFNKGD